ncbi:uncharacterized protein LOC141600145 [Silene latifolia]|uniref:uncharacterized protein LOC141600145 n=1 Tax=Silene latifolia TaxID=37657 RepID=UPI003D77D4EB
MSLWFEVGEQMQPEKNPRMDTGELKAQLFKKIGQERFKGYIHCLNRFISQKLSKTEFNKFCYQILGRENLPLHNKIIRAILKNACSAKTPPPPLQAQEVGPANKAGTAVRTNSPALDDGHGQGPNMAHRQSSAAPIWSNGVLPISPRKGRSTVRDRKLKDRPRPLGPNGKVNSILHQPTAVNDIGSKTLENGDVAPCDYQRPLHLPRGLAEQPENDERLVGVVQGNDLSNASHAEDGKVAAHASHLIFSRRPLVAPLGIPFCPASAAGPRKSLPTHTGDHVSCFDLDGLSDSETLRRRMEQIAVPQGLGITLECANSLNNMVDVYLKGLIRSSLEFVGSRSTSDMSAHPVQKQQTHGKPINGLWPSNHLHMQKSDSQSVSLLDFKVAMELNPQQLGENWPLLLEKISMRGSEE